LHGGEVAHDYEPPQHGAERRTDEEGVRDLLAAYDIAPTAFSATMMVLWLTAGLTLRFGPLVEFVLTGQWVVP
jgi:hypothetical protein